MHRLFYKNTFLAIGFLLFFLSPAHGGTATITGLPFSISMHPAATTVGGYSVYVYFTSYDGNRYSIPQYDYRDGYYYYSQELKRVGNNYRTDYFLIVNGVVDDYGEIYLDLITSDSNSNGVDDVCEKSMAYNQSVSGTWYSHDGTEGSINGRMVKAADSNQGNYTITVNDTYMGDATVTGNYYAGSLSGEMSYTDDGALSVSYTSTWHEQSPLVESETSFTIIDEDHIRINAMETFPATTFSRSGTTYNALVELADGDTGTSWPDYQKWLYTIIDTNDADGDGVPDLSDLSMDTETIAMPWIPLLLLE